MLSKPVTELQRDGGPQYEATTKTVDGVSFSAILYRQTYLYEARKRSTAERCHLLFAGMRPSSDGAVHSGVTLDRVISWSTRLRDSTTRSGDEGSREDGHLDTYV